MNKRLIRFVIIAIITIGGFWLPAANATARTSQKNDPQITRDEFFIVSEVRLKKHQVVMEEPTQITMTMKLTAKTVFMNEQGHRLPVADLRAGDTVYVTYQRDGQGDVTALTIREGPMTVEELHRRYFHN